MKSIVLMLFIFLLTGTLNAEPIKVTIYTDDANRPYSYIENGELKGVYVNIIRAVFDRMLDYDVTITAVPWERGKMLMKKGAGFGLSTAYFHGHDWPYLYPYSLPYASDIINVYCRKEVLKKARHNWPKDYQNLTVGRPTGYDGWGGPEFDEMVNNKTIYLDESRGTLGQILKIGAKRHDCILMEDTSFNFELKSAINNGSFKSDWEKPLLGAEISRNDIYIGYSKKAIQEGKYPFHLDFRQKFDAIIFQMVRSGDVKK
ncbi:MAG: polar amino acid transport system substrate-binding protein [Pseudohongiellaceae bacterium]|jgi:polar amino acid transport system substrate-binding protein